MHPLQSELQNRAEQVTLKLAGDRSAASVLWKYTDGEGSEFYLPKKTTSALHSPYTGKTFTPKPERSSLNDVGKELREDAKAAKEASVEALQKRASELLVKTATPVLWKYVDSEGAEFYLPKKTLTPLHSPYSGKTFTPKPERSSLNDVGKELREESKPEAPVAKEANWKAVIATGKGKAATYLEGIDRVIKAHSDAFKMLQSASMDLGTLADDRRIASSNGLGGLFKKAEMKLDMSFEYMVTPELQKLRTLLADIAEKEQEQDKQGE